MPREAITPNLSDFMRLRLEEIESSRSLPHFLVQRAKIILLAAASKGNSDIAKIIGRHQNTVARWRSRFLEMLPTLETIEADDGFIVIVTLRDTPMHFLSRPSLSFPIPVPLPAVRRQAFRLASADQFPAATHGKAYY